MIANSRYREMYRLTAKQIESGMLFREIENHHLANDGENHFRTEELITLKELTQSHLLADGRAILVRRKLMRDGGWVATHEDITEQKFTEMSLIANAAELERTNMRFDAVMNYMSQGLCMFDAEHRVVVTNARYSEIYHLSRQQVKPGTTVRQILESRHERGTNFALTADEYIQVNMKEANEIQELADGRIVAINRHTMPDGAWLTTHEDITDRARNERKIAFLAQHDMLTALANRSLFGDKLDEARRNFQLHGIGFTVLMLDLDKFKNVNDTLGHPAGDRLLVEAARRLKSSIREGDVVARLGGDEFAIIQAGEKNQHEGAIALATRIIDIIGTPFDLNGHQAKVGTSIGIVFAPKNGIESEDILRKADLALYGAKACGRNGFRLFQAEMTEAVDSQKMVENELREAIARNEFELRYQPVIDVKSHSLRGAEAMVRWRHPLKGLLNGDHFIPLAETTGLMLPLGEWMLQQACKDAATWPTNIKVAINLSAAQFSMGGLFEAVVRALFESGLPPDRLELQIAEIVLSEKEGTHLLTARQLKSLGISMVLKDFGSGYSSTSYLTKFPFDKIKIDKSFIQGVSRRRDCAAVLASVLALANGLDIETIAEGVETQEQFDALRTAGVDFAQGDLFGQTVPLCKFGVQNAGLMVKNVA